MTVDLNLAPDGGGWRGTLADQSKGSLVMTATLTQTLMKGALDGVVSDGSKTVSFLAGTHMLAGSPTAANRFSGAFPDGVLVTFSSVFSEVGVSSVTCPSVVWTLGPK